MGRNAGRVGPTSTRSGGGVWDLPEQYQQVRSGTWYPSVVNGGILSVDDTYAYRAFLSSSTLSVATAPITMDVLLSLIHISEPTRPY